MSIRMTIYDYIIGISIGIGNIGVAFPEVLLVLKGIGISTEFGICTGIGIGHIHMSFFWILLVLLGFGSPWCCLPLDFA